MLQTTILYLRIKMIEKKVGEIMIQLTNLTKKYGDKIAVNNIGKYYGIKMLGKGTVEALLESGGEIGATVKLQLPQGQQQRLLIIETDCKQKGSMAGINLIIEAER